MNPLEQAQAVIDFCSSTGIAVDDVIRAGSMIESIRTGQTPKQVLQENANVAPDGTFEVFRDNGTLKRFDLLPDAVSTADTSRP